VKWTVVGTMAKHGRVRITWQDGKLSGDAVIVSVVQMLAQDLEGELVGPECGPYTKTKHLSNSLSAAILVGRFLEDCVIEGDVPEPPELPEGAIA